MEVLLLQLLHKGVVRRRGKNPQMRAGTQMVIQMTSSVVQDSHQVIVTRWLMLELVVEEILEDYLLRPEYEILEAMTNSHFHLLQEEHFPGLLLLLQHHLLSTTAHFSQYKQVTRPSKRKDRL